MSLSINYEKPTNTNIVPITDWDLRLHDFFPSPRPDHVFLHEYSFLESGRFPLISRLAQRASITFLDRARMNLRKSALKHFKYVCIVYLQASLARFYERLIFFFAWKVCLSAMKKKDMSYTQIFPWKLQIRAVCPQN